MNSKNYKDGTKNSGIHFNYNVVLPVLLSVAILLSTAAALIFYFSHNNRNIINNASDTSSVESDVETPPVEKEKVTAFKSISAVPGADFLTGEVTAETAVDEAKALIDSAARDRFDSINITVNYQNGVIFKTEDAEPVCGDLLNYIYAYAHEKNMKVIATVDIGMLAQKNVVDKNDMEKICSVLSSSALVNNTDMLILKGFCIGNGDVDYSEYSSSGQDVAYNEFQISQLNHAMQLFYSTVAKANPTLYTGVECDGIYTADGSDSEQYRLLDDGYADVISWINGGYADFAVVYNPYSTDAEELNFEAYAETWNSLIGSSAKVFYKLAYTNIGSDQPGWEMTDQIVQQLMKLDNMGISGFIIDGYISFVNDTTESRTAVLKYLNGKISSDYILRDLTISSPEKETFTTYQNFAALSGASDPEFSLKLNGKEVERTELGYFSIDLDLEIGKNTFKLEHKGVTKTFNITYTKVIIKDFTPQNAQTLEGGSTLGVSVTALIGSTVTATLDGTVCTLSESPIVDGSGIQDSEYANFTGQFTMPVSYDGNVSLGKITFKAVSAFGTSTKTSGKITVKKSEKPVDPTQTLPQGGNYIDVGNTYVAEVVTYQAETFNAGDTYDYSRPTNIYLPKGTVDYCSAYTTTNGSTVMRTLRYGKQVYTTHKGVENIRIYEGTLPNTNTVTVVDTTGNGQYTKITFDVAWKAPFTLDIKPQTYNSEVSTERDYRISSFTATYIDITFCYATVVEGAVELGDSNPIFKKAEWIKNTSDHTLRLYLNKTGGLYGWSAEYNDEGQLVFSFLNPAKITQSDNKYGYSLEGITVAIDVGHGGNDPGAAGANPNYQESDLNLKLALALKSELESIGAKVVMNRSTDVTLSNDERCIALKNSNADFCISIHRNSSNSTSPRGFQAFHYNAYSSDAAKAVFNAVNNSDTFSQSKWTDLRWHAYYVSRAVTDCPFVLTENGFISNSQEYNQMMNDQFNSQTAAALTQGIVDYFVSIQ